MHLFEGGHNSIRFFSQNGPTELFSYRIFLIIILFGCAFDRSVVNSDQYWVLGSGFPIILCGMCLYIYAVVFSHSCVSACLVDPVLFFISLILLFPFLTIPVLPNQILQLIYLSFFRHDYRLFP